MVDPLLGLMVGLIVVVVGLAIWWRWKKDKETTEAYRRLCAEHGWQLADKDSSVDERYRGLDPFGKGSNRYARWRVRGEHASVPFELFSYHYQVTTSNGKTTQTHHYWHRVCSLRMPIASPGLVIKDEHLGHKLWDAVGGEDIDLESDAFSSRFWVKSPDRRFAYDVLHTGMMDYLLERTGWVWQWQGDRLVVFDEEGRLDPEDALMMLELLAGFRERLPRHLLAETG